MQYFRQNPGEIRLLELDISGRGLHTLYSNVLLSQALPYAALSYPWHNPHENTARPHVLNVNEANIPVSQNLSRAIMDTILLWRTEPHPRRRPLIWVDQICIWQANNAEKAVQVRMMGDIYRRARQVLIWLPVKAGFSGRFHNWREWHSWHTMNVRPRQRPTNPEIPKDRVWALLMHAWQNISCVVESPWWRRAWVFQEFMLATDAIFLVGGLALRWEELHRTLRPFFGELSNHVARCERKLERVMRRNRNQTGCLWACFRWVTMNAGKNYIRYDLEAKLRRHLHKLDVAHQSWDLARSTMRIKETRRNYMDLSELVIHGEDRECTNPLDKVFAFLGLAVLGHGINIDYDIHINELLVNVARSIIIGEESLSIIAIPTTDVDRRGSYPAAGQLPTWVPNWIQRESLQAEFKRYTRKLVHESLTSNLTDTPYEQQAARDTAPAVRFLPDRYRRPNRILQAGGIHVARLNHVVGGRRRYPGRHWADFRTDQQSLHVSTTSAARHDDEVWVFFGMDEPCVVRWSYGRHSPCVVVGPAMLWYRNTPSPVNYGEMIDRWRAGRVQAEWVFIT